VLHYWPFGESWCRIWLAVDVWMCTASIYNLVAISIDRYIAVSRPIRQSHVSRARQTTHRRRLDSLVRHLLPAAYRLERRSRREIGCSRLQPHRTCQCVFTESHRYVNQLVSENLSKSLLTPTTMSKQHCRTKFCHFDKVETTS